MTRRLSKQESRERWAQLQALVNEWDPIGVMDDPDWPRDEYDCLVGSLMRHLESGSSPSDIADFLRRDIEEHFGLDPKHIKFSQFSKRMSSWYAAGWSDTRA